MHQKRRPELAAAIAAIEAGEADALVAAKPDRLSRSQLDFASLLERAQRKRWEIVVLDQEFDMTTASGREMAGMVIGMAQWERDTIRERTRAALAARRRRGERVGRPASEVIPTGVRARIVKLSRRGMSRNGIASVCNGEGVPTAAGARRWDASTITRVLEREEA